MIIFISLILKLDVTKIFTQNHAMASCIILIVKKYN